MVQVPTEMARHVSGDPPLSHSNPRASTLKNMTPSSLRGQTLWIPHRDSGSATAVPQGTWSCPRKYPPRKHVLCPQGLIQGTKVCLLTTEKITSAIFVAMMQAKQLPPPPKKEKNKTRSSAQGNCSAKSLAASVMSSILPCPPCLPPVMLSGGCRLPAGGV